MTVKEALTQGSLRLKDANIEAPVLEAGVLLCFVMACDRSYLYAHDDSVLSKEEETAYLNYIGFRAGGMPLQYLTGRQEFMSLEFSISPGVLIPRQDTEVLVETVLNYLKKTDLEKPLVLDMGTGSGCIAVSIAHFNEKCRVIATDISVNALDIARRNAGKNGVSERLVFIKSDLFENLQYLPGCLFDVIVSNPPYIPDGQIPALQDEVKHHEPYIALSGGNDGLDFYRAITEEARKYLKPGGMAPFEVGMGQAQAVADLMAAAYEDIAIIKDLSQIDRVVTGKMQCR